jgi:hypothetical protein
MDFSLADLFAANMFLRSGRGGAGGLGSQREPGRHTCETSRAGFGATTYLDMAIRVDEEGNSRGRRGPFVFRRSREMAG